MKIINVEQGSKEWILARKGVLTASNFSKVVQMSGKKSTSQKELTLDLVSQMFMDDVEETFISNFMQRGTDLEPLARKAYEEYALMPVEQVGLITSDCGQFGCSPDGLVSEDGMIEIKCPMAKNHLKYLNDNKIPSIYFCQIQGGLMVTERKWCDFISFNPEIKINNGLFIKRMYRDDDFIGKLISEIQNVIKNKNSIYNDLISRYN